MNDKKLNMQIANESLDLEEKKLRILRIKVRVKGILKALVENVNGPQVKGPIIKFFQRFMIPRQYLPDEYLLNYEKDKLQLDDIGRIM